MTNENYKNEYVILNFNNFYMKNTKKRRDLILSLKMVFIRATGNEIAGMSDEQCEELVEKATINYGETIMSSLIEEVLTVGRDPLAAAAQCLFPPGIELIDISKKAALEQNIKNLLCKYNL